jgi:hypothetical protein
MRPGTLRVVLTGCCALSVFLAGNAFADELRERFDLVGFGMSRQTVLALIPPVTDVAESTTFGVPYALLRWQTSSRGPAFTISFIGGRVYAKSTCDRATDC